MSAPSRTSFVLPLVGAAAVLTGICVMTMMVRPMTTLRDLAA